MISGATGLEGRRAASGRAPNAHEPMPTAGSNGSTRTPRRSSVGTVSLAAAVAGAIGSRIARVSGPLTGAPWLDVAAAGFDAAMVGALADWFAVTALFRHPLGIPIPHTAIIPARRQKIIESIVSMVEDDWLSPRVIAERLARFAPSELVVEWLRDLAHVERLGGPLRDLLRGLARLLTEPEVAEFAERAIQTQLRDVPIDASTGRWLEQTVASESAAAAFESMALSLANLAERPRTAAQLHWWMDRSAGKLREEGKRLVPLFLRRKIVQRKLVEAACGYASSELRSAAHDPAHPLRALVFGAIERFAQRLAAGDPQALTQIERLRQALLESLTAAPLVRDALARLRHQLENDLADPGGYLADLVDRELRAGIAETLDDHGRRAAFDHWVRTTVDELLRRHHHQIGLTVRENLERLDPNDLVAQIEGRVGSDLQFIRLNGAVVGGLIGVLLALVHRLMG